MSELPQSPTASDMEAIGNIDHLLINARKKTQSHDAISILSSGSERSRRSLKYVEDPSQGALQSSLMGAKEGLKVKLRDDWMSADDEGSSDASSARVRRRKKAALPRESDVESVKPPPSERRHENEQQQQPGDKFMRRPKNEVEAVAIKRELLYEFDRLRSKGIRLPRMYSLDMPLEELQADYMRIRRDRELDAGIMFQRQALMMCVSGIEFLSTNFSPLDCKLEGWSHRVSDSIDSYDDILEELYVKYRGSAKMAPELRLLMALGGSAIMFSMENRIASMAESMLRGDMPASAAGRPTRSRQQANGGGGGNNMFGALGSMLGGLFGQASAPVHPNTPPQQAHHQHQHHEQYAYQPAAPVRGPTLNVDNVLRNLQQNAFEKSMNDQQRVEIISTVSESDVPDDASLMSGSFPTKKKASRVDGHKRTLDLSAEV